MKIKELRKKSEKELVEFLKEFQEKLRDLRFRASQNQLKSVREIRQLKKLIAQLLTLLKEKAQTKAQ